MILYDTLISYNTDGELGTGKSMSLAHIIHYALMTKKIIVHAPWRKKENISKSCFYWNNFSIKVFSFRALGWLKIWKILNLLSL